ncbi:MULTISPECIES: hypothetical protein [Serratia]|uniref:hypothetical protein n=1 Tax=Serratia TaxID=613 RepID=UPI001F4C44CE|nr:MULTISPECIES: hypothetical protein [Serratia]ULG14421.1 Spa1 [Serratia proteamaculans]CAI1207490.1 Uncharacterised protein [Serratia quinivorans]CAI1215040.1 Uncharacterised protein [Serratia quinivorans]CAI1973481.1 Uncharacterised protein [Serratia entomophila]
MTQRKNYSLNAKHNQMLNEQAVNLTGILSRPVACRDVLEAILDLTSTLDNTALAQQVLDRVNEPKRGRRPGPRKNRL